MPLLLCPNCNVSMQSVNRSDVEFDMCPSCRGVWLDRGELEKIMAASREDGSRTAAPAAADPRRYDDDDRRRYRDDDYRYKKKRSIFDIFD